MSNIRGKHTKPELAVRKLAHRLGYRFRLHRRDLPGTPDLVFPRYRTVLQVHGCFWHGHAACRNAVEPRSNVEFWKAKIDANRSRDRFTADQLSALGWSVLTIWECEIANVEQLATKLSAAMPR